MNNITKMIAAMLGVNLLLSAILLFLPLLYDSTIEVQSTTINTLNIIYKIFILINIHIIILAFLDLIAFNDIELARFKFKVIMILSIISFVFLTSDILLNISVMSVTIGYFIYLIITIISIVTYKFSEKISRDLS